MDVAQEALGKVSKFTCVLNFPTGIKNVVNKVAKTLLRMSSTKEEVMQSNIVSHLQHCSPPLSLKWM